MDGNKTVTLVEYLLDVLERKNAEQARQIQELGRANQDLLDSQRRDDLEFRKVWTQNEYLKLENERLTNEVSRVQVGREVFERVGAELTRVEGARKMYEATCAELSTKNEALRKQIEILAEQNMKLTVDLENQRGLNRVMNAEAEGLRLALTRAHDMMRSLRDQLSVRRKNHDQE